MDRLTSLTVFARVAESGGFSAAARRLNMSVTMVSAHVQALEDRLGARLLNRTTRKVSLTEIGKAYYERSIQILSELDEADRIAATLQARPSGKLRLYANTHLARFLSPVIGEFLTLYPAVSIDLEVGERMADLIEEGFDLAIRAAPPPDSRLIVRNLTPWRHILCCAPVYLEKHPPPLAPSDLADHNCLRYPFYPFGNEWRFEGPDGALVGVRVSGNIVSNSGETLRILALAGHGLLLAPTFLFNDEMVKGTLVPLMPAYRPIEFAINAIYANRHHLSSKIRSFLDLLAERFAEHGRSFSPEDFDGTVSLGEVEDV